MLFPWPIFLVLVEGRAWVGFAHDIADWSRAESRVADSCGGAIPQVSSEKKQVGTTALDEMCLFFNQL